MNKKDERLDMRAQLRAVPVRNRSTEQRPLPDGGVAFSVQAAPPGVVLGGVKRLLKVAHRSKTVRLDCLGAEVLQACDGRKTVEEIVDHFAASHKLTFHEARLGVMQFLKILMQHNAVGLAVPESEQPTSE
jgi:hypothetical protein